MEEPVSGTRKLLLSLIFTFAAVGVSSANNVYLAQTAQGGNTGADCADAKAVSYFNNSSNWTTTGSGVLIGAGTTVYLCSGGGEITTNLNFQGNGSGASPVVVDCNSGSNATMDAYIGEIATTYWTIQNCTWDTSFATNSATQAVIETSGGAAFGIIQNNHIDIMSSSQVIFFGHISHDITVQNNYLKVSTPSGGDGFDTDVLDTEGAYNVLVEGNYIAMNIGAGDETCGGCHDDLTQVWAADGSPANAPYNWTYRYNYFVQESSPTKANNQSLMMMENIGSGYWNVYSNVFQCVSSGSSGNGITFDSNTSGMTANIYANTVVENAGACNNLFNISGSGSYNLEDNIVYNTDAGNALTGGETFASRGYNLWFGPNIPSCSGFPSDVCGSNPLFTNYATNDFSLQSGSPAKGAAANLGTSYNPYPQPETTWPNPTVATRPSTGNWDIGAYYGVAPPTSLTATVH
jgi:hypothetical protein